VDIPVLKTRIESAWEATRFAPTLVVKVTGIDPGSAYCSTTVLVLWPTTLVGWLSGGLPSWSTSPAASPETESV
jgi:hypothetical protein